MKRVPRKAREFRFSKDIKPKIRVKLREEFAVETEDCFNGELKKMNDLPVSSQLSFLARFPPLMNPLGGPIYVEGVEPGDILVVDIVDITLDMERGQGVTAVVPGFGPLKDSATWQECRGPSAHFIKHVPGSSGTLSDGKAVFSSRLSWDLRPFFGTIGVAPDHESVSSLTGPYVSAKGGWGGNWDSRDVCKGSKIYLQAYNPGALFFVGDLHASQGDGELCGVADETSGEGIFSCDVIKKRAIPYARIEKKDSIIQLNNGRPLERIIEEAFVWMMGWLVTDFKFGKLESHEFLSVCPDVRINVYQMVPPDHYTVGIEVPKKYLA